MADLGQVADTYKSVKKLVGLGKKKKKKRSAPSPSTLLGRHNLTRSPLSSNYSFIVGRSNSAKALKSKVINGKRI